MSADESLLTRLAEILGAGHVLTAAQDVAPFLADWRGRYQGRTLAVVRPGETATVAAVVRACAEADVAIVPQGGKTGLCGAATPDGSGRSVVVSLGRMNRIRALDPVGNTMTVDAGCVLATIRAVADGVDRLFPMSLGSEGSAQIGGNLSTNAGGTAVLRYGTMRDLVLGIEAVLPDGRVLEALRGLRKDNTGYDLKQLFIGAEGTLGIITGAVLKLFPKPKASVTALASLRSVEDALKLLAHLRAGCGDRLAQFEIMSDSEMAMVEAQTPDVRFPLAERAPWYQLIELADTLGDLDLAAVLERALGEAAEAGMVRDAIIAQSAAQAEALWHIRHSVSESHKKGGVSMAHDTSVPIDRLPDFVARTASRVGAAFPDVNPIYVGHIGDGNIHFVAHFHRDRFADAAAFEAAAAEINAIVYDIATALGGSISAEHGIGQSLRNKLPRYKSSIEMELMRGIKAMLDPQGLMNPGKVI